MKTFPYLSILMLAASMAAATAAPQNSQTLASLPGYEVNALSGQLVKTALPGQLVPVLPGQLVPLLPGQWVRLALPGQVVKALPGQLVSSLPGEIVGEPR
jgi:hypothetical protein